MSLPALKWAVEFRGLKAREKSILLLLAWHTNSRTGLCNPSIRTLCEESGMAKDTVGLAIDGLEETGLIDIIPPKRRDASNRYILNMDSVLEEGKATSGRVPNGRTRGVPNGRTRRVLGVGTRRVPKHPPAVSQTVGRKGNERGDTPPPWGEDDEIIIPLHGRAG